MGVEITIETKQEIVELAFAGYSNNEIARELNLTSKDVWKVLYPTEGNQ
jgi:DNA-binding NarL/FixJ family response regulator